MNRRFFLLCLSIALLTGAGCAQTDSGTVVPAESVSATPCGDGVCDAAEQKDDALCPEDCPSNVDASDEDAEETFAFVADAGIRMENASNSGVRFNSNGTTLSLLYEDRVAGGSKVAEASQASDWLDFTVTQSDANPATFRALRLPDGTCRAYGLDATKSGVLPGSTGLKSKSSVDCVTFTEDEGTRYELADSDNGSMGVYDLFIDSKGGVVLLYLGDLHGKNNLRRAYSTDGGWTFVLQDDDVLGDADSTDGSYVDNKVIVLPDGSVRMVSMKNGGVYTFLSTDDGVTWTRDPGRLSASDFAGQELIGLYDPQIIRLPDGRYRIYVTGGMKGSGPGDDSAPANLYSATTN